MRDLIRFETDAPSTQKARETAQLAKIRAERFLTRYEKKELRLDELEKATDEQLSAVMCNIQEKNSVSHELAIIASRIFQGKHGNSYTVPVTNHTEMKGAEWFISQPCRLTLTVSSPGYVRQLSSQINNRKETVFFNEVTEPLLVAATLAHNGCAVNIIRSDDKDVSKRVVVSGALKDSQIHNLHLQGSSVNAVHKHAHAQTLISGFAQLGDFTLTMPVCAFEPNLELVHSTLKLLHITGSVEKLKSGHLACLRRIPDDQQTSICIEGCEFFDEEVKRGFFRLAWENPRVSFASRELQERFEAFKKEQERIKSERIVAVRALLVRNAHGDLQIRQDFSLEMYQAIVDVASYGIPEFTQNDEFLKIWTIAMLIHANFVLTSSHEYRVSGVVWLLEHDDQQRKFSLQGFIDRASFSRLAKVITKHDAMLRVDLTRLDVSASEAEKAEIFALVDKGEIQLLEKTAPKALWSDYCAYKEGRDNLVRVQALIEQYKNNTLTYEELFDPKNKCAVSFIYKQPADANIDKEALNDLFVILVFDNDPLKIELTNPRALRAAEWLIARASARKVRVKCRTPQEMQQLIAASDRNNSLTACVDLSVMLDKTCELRYATYEEQQGRGYVYLTGQFTAGNAESVGYFNSFVNSITKDCELTFDGNFSESVDLSGAKIQGITLLNQHITAAHVAMLERMSTLKVFVAKGCTFENPLTRTNFVRAVLRNTELVNVSLVSCELVKEHLDALQDYACRNPGLIEIDVNSNAFRRGEDTELNQTVRDNKKRQKDEQALRAECEGFLSRLKICESSLFSEMVKNLRALLLISSGAYKKAQKDSVCIRAYGAALISCAAKMTFSDFAIFEAELKALDSLVALSSLWERAITQRLAEGLATHAACAKELNDSVLALLVQRKYVSPQLLTLQRKRFDALAYEFRCIRHNIARQLGLVETMCGMVVENSPPELVEALHVVLTELSDFYFYSHEVSVEAENKILGYLLNLPAIDFVEMRIRQLFFKRIKNILVSDFEREGKQTQFQEDSLNELEVKVMNRDFTLREMQGWIAKFIDDSSSLSFREKYITNRSHKVTQLENCSKTMQQYLREPVVLSNASAKTVSDAIAVEEDARKEAARGASVYDAPPSAESGVANSFAPAPVGPAAFFQPAASAPPAPSAPAPEPVELPHVPRQPVKRLGRQAESENG